MCHRKSSNYSGHAVLPDNVGATSTSEIQFCFPRAALSIEFLFKPARPPLFAARGSKPAVSVLTDR
jgi:hypothetical protein